MVQYATERLEPAMTFYRVVMGQVLADEFAHRRIVVA